MICENRWIYSLFLEVLLSAYKPTHRKPDRVEIEVRVNVGIRNELNKQGVILKSYGIWQKPHVF
jgi:hypothetical protein